MNLLILNPEDFTGSGVVHVTGRRLRHMIEVRRAKLGDTVAVGLLGGALGLGRIIRLDGEALEMTVELHREPPPKLPLTLVLALPRPVTLNRIMATATTLGVARIFLVNAWKVDKSYWYSPALAQENLVMNQILGLEQSMDTRLPEVHLRRLLRPFAEDELPDLIRGTLPLLAHPGAALPCPRTVQEPVTLVIGPEAGFIPQEVDLLARSGCQPVHLGPRILRVETALSVLVGRLF